MNKINHITVFEHDKLLADDKPNSLTYDQLKSLQIYHGEKGVSYFTLINNGIKFCEYVGIIQIGNLTVEVLPKGDKSNNKNEWRDKLIGMIRLSGVFQIDATSSSNLKLKSNSILDLYFEIFVDELQNLQHKGLVKKYRRATINTLALKGCIQFSQHINRNFVHQERFFVKQGVYDMQHQLHQIIFKTLNLIKSVNTNSNLNGKLSSILLDFPEQSDIDASDKTFFNINFNRKTESYKNIIAICRLLLLNYHPDISKGENNVLALMFDMNLLWERFVYSSLHRYNSSGFKIEIQASKKFWKPINGTCSNIRPDIVINREKADCVVLDTKWKNLDSYSPSSGDLRQMFVYHEYFNAKKVALLYPGQSKSRKGTFYSIDGKEGVKECTLVSISSKDNIIHWQKDICNRVEDWISE